MPSPVKKGGRRISINTWRVKCGRVDIFSGQKGDCNWFVREFQKHYPKKLRVVPPND